MLRRGLSVFLLIVSVLLLVACRGRGEELGLVTPQGTAIALPTTAATSVAATSTVATAVPAPTGSATPLVITAAPSATVAGAATAAPPTAPPPTVSAGPPPGGSARITFAPGATSAVVSSSLAAGGDGDTWLLRVNAGQVITVQTIANPPGQMNVQLLDANGGFLAGNVDTGGIISAAAPVTGDYQINLATASGAPAVAYSLQVLVPPGGGQVTPQRIQFAPGQATTQLLDSLAAGGDLNSYVINVAAGQTIQVQVFASPPAATNIYIRNAAGQQITSGTDMSGASATAATAGDYFIDISNFNAAPAVNYTLTVTVPPLNQPPPVDPVRISFGPGQTSALLSGGVAANAPAHYVIAIAAGQTLITDLNDNPPGNVEITINDPSGNIVNFGRGPTSLGTVAVTTGDYYIRLTTTSAAAVSYALTVNVPPLPGGGATRIQFAPGATSATVGGDLPFGGDSDTWVIGGLAGQALNVTISVAEAVGWVRVYVYDAAGSIIALGTDITGAHAPLNETGDYRIVVISDQAAGPLSYSLTAEIP